MRNGKADLDAAEQWAQLLEREQHVVDCDQPPDSAYVHAPHAGTAAMPGLERCELKSLTLPLPPGVPSEEAAPLSMALSAT